MAGSVVLPIQSEFPLAPESSHVPDVLLLVLSQVGFGIVIFLPISTQLVPSPISNCKSGAGLPVPIK